MKKKLLLGATLLTCSAMLVQPAFAATTIVDITDEVETDVVEDLPIAEEESAYKDTFWNDSIYGEYYGVTFIDGDYDASLTGETLILLPGGKVDHPVINGYTMKGDDITFSFVEEFQGLGVTITGKVDTVLPELVEDYKNDYYMIDSDQTAIYVTATRTFVDDSNPLEAGEKTITGTTLFVKDTDQYRALEDILFGSKWTIDGKDFVITEDLIDLDNGADTGYPFVFARTGELHAYVEFCWDKGGFAKYYVSEMSDDTVTLVNVDTGSEVVLKNAGPADVTEDDIPAIDEKEAGSSTPDPEDIIEETNQKDTEKKDTKKN